MAVVGASLQVFLAACSGEALVKHGLGFSTTMDMRGKTVIVVQQLIARGVKKKCFSCKCFSYSSGMKMNLWVNYCETFLTYFSELKFTSLTEWFFAF